MVTHALALSGALLEAGGPETFTVFSSRERVPGLPAGYEAVLSPHRHEVANKLLWFPSVEGASGLDAILYPYWPPPARRLGKHPPPLLRGAQPRDRVADDPAVHRYADREGRPRGRKLLEDEGEGDRRRPEATVGLGHIHAEHAQLPERPDHVQGDRALGLGCGNALA